MGAFGGLGGGLGSRFERFGSFEDAWETLGVWASSWLWFGCLSLRGLGPLGLTIRVEGSRFRDWWGLRFRVQGLEGRILTGPTLPKGLEFRVQARPSNLGARAWFCSRFVNVDASWPGCRTPRL